MTNTTRNTAIWQQPWGYTHSAISVSAIVVVGLLLQLIIGDFNFFLLARPANYIALAIITAIIVLLSSLSAIRKTANILSGIPMSLSLIVSFTLLTIIMGITPQSNHQSHTRLALDAMTKNWAFILIYILLLLSLGTLIARRIKQFRWKDYSFYLNHIGLWIFLVASGLGYADMERYVMHVQEGETEWRVFDDEDNMKELPIAITLNDFDMDYYAPKLAIIDKETGDILPHNKPQFLQIDTLSPIGKLNEWTVEIHQYIHQAVRSSDSTYRAVPMPGATPAVKVTATKGNTKYTSWICGGNQAQLFMTMPLDEQSSMVMTVADPRVFTSNIAVYTQNEKQAQAVIEVNKPLSIDNWTIYQYGYDNEAGRLSSYSSFELVYDPWITPVYLGIIMMMMGSITMLWFGKAKKEKLL
ncbi:MAG: cytochrome c biogenesis protein ResB [Bacteroidales bacterium]